MTGVGALGGATGGRCLDGNFRERHHRRSIAHSELGNNGNSLHLTHISLPKHPGELRHDACHAVSQPPPHAWWRDMVEANVTLSQPT